jgi:hypothetical protein
MLVDRLLSRPQPHPATLATGSDNQHLRANGTIRDVRAYNDLVSNERFRAISICRTCYEVHAASDPCPTCTGIPLPDHTLEVASLDPAPRAPRRHTVFVAGVLFGIAGLTAFSLIFAILRS